MSELTEFLLARIAEDEAGARDGMPERLADWGRSDPYSFDPEYQDVTMQCGRALAECEAKRRIVELHAPDEQEGMHCCTDPESPSIGELMHYGGDPCRTLRLLALPYAGHPDYREEWKP